MEIVSIFANERTKEGLHSIQYENEAPEYIKVINDWLDAEYVLNYLKNEEHYIKSSIYKDFSIVKLADKINNEAEKLDQWLYDYSQERFISQSYSLQHIFKPYYDLEPVADTQQKSKAKVVNIKKPILRIYSIKISDKTFVVTGGAIKLTHKMKEHPHTIAEDNKMAKVLEFIKQHYIIDEEDLKYYYEQEE